MRDRDESYQRALGKPHMCVKEKVRRAVSHPPNGRSQRRRREREITKCDGEGAMSIFVKINVQNYNRTIVITPVTFVIIPVVP